MSCDLIDELKELRNYHVNRLILSPKQWSQYCVDIDLNWEIVKFDKKNKNLIPNNQSGVYTFVIKPNIANHPECAYLMYVGKTERQTFRDRFMQYFRERKKGRPRIKAMLALWPNNIWFCYASIPDKTVIDQVESALINAYLPPMNDNFPGAIKEAIKAW